MKAKTSKIVLIIVVLFLVIQIIPVDRSNPQAAEGLSIAAPPEVKAILKNACFDCHSNETVWPLYSYVAPISWFVAHHVDEGRDEFNLSVWQQIEAKKQRKIAAKMIEEVEEGKMPLSSYLWLHKEARLSEQQKAKLFAWLRTMGDE